MYTFFAYLILLLHISAWSLAQEVEITPVYEICDYLEEHVDHSTVNPLTIDQAAEDRTIKCVESYSVTIETQEQAENYLIVEVYAYSQNSDFDTYLVTNSKTRPEIWYNNSERIINETYDVNANVYRKSYHHITYRPTSLQIGKKIYFSIYNLPIDDGTPLVSATYSISAKSAPVYPCPQSCSGNGYCDENLEKCICNRTFFDEDCTVQATEIIEGQFTSRDFPIEDYQLFFFEVLNSAVDLQLSYTKTQGEIALAYTMNRQNNFNLPNYDGRIISNNITYDAKQSYFNIFQQALSYRSVLLVEVTNTDITNTVTFQAKVNKFVDKAPDRNTLMIIMIGVSAFFILSWGVLTLVKFKNHRQAETLLQARNVNGPEQRDLLSKEDLDRFFKKKKYRECQSNFPQNTCSICLEDFHGESVCRQLYCDHVYHGTCIESWLSQHNSCPNCKKDMTKAAIEEYLASPKLLDEIKEEEEVEKNDRVDGVRMPLPRSLAPLEEIKEDYARSLNDIIIQHRDEKISKKMSESLTGPPLERKGSSLRGTPKYLEPRPGFMHRKIDEMYRKNTQDPMDFEERDVREKSDMNNSIMLRMNQNKSRNISEINPLNRRSMEKNSADDEDSHL